MVETLDLIRNSLPDKSPRYTYKSSSFVIVFAWNIAERDEQRGSLDRIDIRRDDFITRVRLFAPFRPGLRVKQGRRNERRLDERRENDEKWTVDEDSFSTDTLAVRARESADENRHVSFLALFHRVSRRPSFLSPFPPSLLLLRPSTR